MTCQVTSGKLWSQGLSPALFSLAGIPNLCPQLWSKLLEPRLLILSGRFLAEPWFASRLVLVKLLSHVPLFASPWTAARQASLSITISQSLLKPMSIKSVMPANHLILCCPLSSCSQSFPASGSLSVSQLFALGGQRIGASASASFCPTNIQGWFYLDWLVWSPCCPRACLTIIWADPFIILPTAYQTQQAGLGDMSVNKTQSFPQRLDNLTRGESSIDRKITI